MNESFDEKRQHTRFDTEAKISFRINYDLTTKVEYQLFDKIKKIFIDKKYGGLTRNVSCSGLGFTCDQPLKGGEVLKLEVYIPGVDTPIQMQGEVRWCRQDLSDKKNKVGDYEVGIKVLTVNGISVADTVHFDETYQIEWSIVLESLLGNYRIFAQKNNPPSKT